MILPTAVRRIGLRRIGLNVVSSLFWMLFGLLPQARAGNVHVDRRSASSLVQPLAIAANGGGSISCDSTSLLYGDLTGVAGINCTRIERAQAHRVSARVRP